MYKEIIKRTLRVPVDNTSTGDSMGMVVGLDATLISNGFKLSPELFMALSTLKFEDCLYLSQNILSSVKELIGAHVKHNVYFQEFPNNVPDTEDFWFSCIVDALGNSASAKTIAQQLSFGYVNLLDLPKYGKYLHSYESMVAVHEAFIGEVKNFKVLQLGGNFEEELTRLYHSLAGSSIPLSESDRELLSKLSRDCIDLPQPESIPMRENRAIINDARVNCGVNILVDTVTDILRLACHLSGGDVTLAEKTKFKSFPRATRRILLSALDNIDPDKFVDINLYAERWKRLFERLHPWEYRKFEGAIKAHSVSMGLSEHPLPKGRGF